MSSTKRTYTGVFLLFVILFWPIFMVCVCMYKEMPVGLIVINSFTVLLAEAALTILMVTNKYLLNELPKIFFSDRYSKFSLWFNGNPKTSNCYKPGCEFIFASVFGTCISSAIFVITFLIYLFKLVFPNV